MGRKAMTVAEKLKHYREACALSQQQVAAALKAERSTYGKYETGVTEPNLNSLVKLSKIFNISATELLPELGEEMPTYLQVRDLHNEAAIYQLSKEERGLIAQFRVLNSEERDQIKDLMAKMSKKDEGNPIK